MPSCPRTPAFAKVRAVLCPGTRGPPASSPSVLEPFDRGGGLRVVELEIDRRARAPAAPLPGFGLGQDSFRGLQLVRLVVALKRIEQHLRRLVGFFSDIVTPTMPQASRAWTVDEGGLPVCRRLACRGRPLGALSSSTHSSIPIRQGFMLSHANCLPIRATRLVANGDRRAINVRGGQPTDDSRHVDIGEEGGVREIEGVTQVDTYARAETRAGVDLRMVNKIMSID
jgi:hypothetical protein